jgi:hypothetical protein
MDEQPETAIGVAGAEKLEKLYDDETAIGIAVVAEAAAEQAQLAWSEKDPGAVARRKLLGSKESPEYQPWGPVWGRAGVLLGLGVSVATVIGIGGWLLVDTVQQPQTITAVAASTRVPELLADPPVAPTVTVQAAPSTFTAAPTTVTVQAAAPTTARDDVHSGPTHLPPGYSDGDGEMPTNPTAQDQAFLNNMSRYGPLGLPGSAFTPGNALFYAEEICGLYRQGYSASQVQDTMTNNGIPRHHVIEIDDSAQKAYQCGPASTNTNLPPPGAGPNW